MDGGPISEGSHRRKLQLLKLIRLEVARNECDQSHAVLLCGIETTWVTVYCGYVIHDLMGL